MNQEWVQVRNCNWLHEAQFVQSVLESEGIDVFLPDEHVLGVQPFYANALGGVRVLVRAHDLVDGFGGKEVWVDLGQTEGQGFKVIH